MLGLIGRVGSLFRGLPAARVVPSSIRSAPTSLPGRILQGFGGIENASFGLGGLMFGSNLVRQATDSFGITPSYQTLRQMQAGRNKMGRNYTVGGIEYDFRSGRPVNPPVSVFSPPEETLQAGQFTPPPGAPPALGAVSNGAGVPAQRQNVQQRTLSQEVLNAAQQYAAPTGIPLSSFYAGQQQLGRSMEQTGELQRQLRDLGGAAGMADEPFMAWVKANPGLAYRELIKRQRGM